MKAKKPIRIISGSKGTMWKSPRERTSKCIAICKKGKRRGYGKEKDRMIWTKGKAYKCKIQSIAFSDGSIVERYFIMTNRRLESELEVLDSVEFKQRFRVFTKV